MKKILFTANSLNIGGMEKALVSLLNNLASKYDIYLILENNTGILKESLDDRIKVFEYKLAHDKIVYIRKFKNFFKRFIWSIFNFHKYDFSCSFATYSIIGSRLSLVASKNSALYIHSDYSEYYNNNNKEIINFFETLNYKKFKNLIFVSKESCKKIMKILDLPTTKIKVINNLVDVNDVINKSLEKSDLSIFKKENINLLYVGRLDNTSKNFDLLLESIEKVKDNNIKLFIVGNGYYKEKICQKINNLNLNNNVFLLGEKVNPYPYMRACDAIILTSKYEGFPIVYSEAIILNKKVITTIKVSDDNLNVKKIFYCVNQDSLSISNAIKSINKDSINYKINFLTINKNNLKKIEDLIES